MKKKENILFLVTSGFGWGIGRTLTDAFDQYNKHNKKIKVGDMYGLAIYEAKDKDDVKVDTVGYIYTKANVTQLYSSVEVK